MRITNLIMIVFLFFLMIFLPLGALFAFIAGYSFEPASYLLFAAFVALVAAAAVVLSIKKGQAATGKAEMALYALLPLISLINAAFCAVRCGRMYRWWIVGFLLLCFCCCIFLMVRYGKALSVKICSLILTALIFPFAVFLIVVSLIFGNISENSVVSSVESPDGKYRADVIANDQGAFGGNTLVNIYWENRDIDLLFVRIVKMPRKAYRGRLDESDDMEVYWKNGTCLVVNGREYVID